MWVTGGPAELKVFIAGSIESSELLMFLAQLVEEEGHEPLPWNKPGLFPLGGYLFETLQQIGKEVDAAIVIFNEDDKVWYRDDMTKQPRDNVLMEYGLLSGILGTRKTIVGFKGSPKIASDLKGVMLCDLNRQYKAQAELKQWLKRLSTARTEAGIH